MLRAVRPDSGDVTSIYFSLIAKLHRRAAYARRSEYRVIVTQNCSALRIYDTRELAVERRRRRIRFAARPLEQLQVCGRDFEISIYLVSDFRLYFMERPLSVYA